MAARYALQSFVVQLPSGASHHVELGALRDSTHGAVTAAPALFSTVQPSVHPRLAAYEQNYPSCEIS